MQQLTLARQAEFQRYGKKTRREQFLEEMEAVMPWAELLSLVAPYYSKGETGRKPVGLAITLRVYFLQQWFSLSDPAAEDALYESSVLRRFAGIDLGRAPAPDETTVLNFRHLLEEEHNLCDQMLDAVNLPDNSTKNATIVKNYGSAMSSRMVARAPKPSSRLASDTSPP